MYDRGLPLVVSLALLGCTGRVGDGEIGDGASTGEMGEMGETVTPTEWTRSPA